MPTQPKNLPPSPRDLSVEETEAVAGGVQIHVIPEPPPTVPGDPQPPPPKVVIT